MSNTPEQDARPQQATIGAWTVIGAGALYVFSTFDQMRDLRSIETRDRITETLSAGGFGVSVDQMLGAMHIGLLISGAAAAAAVIMGVQALARNKVAPRVLIGLSALVIIGSVLFDPLLGMFLAAGTVMLWSGPARDWFTGRPVRASRMELAMSEPSNTNGGPPQSNQPPANQPPADAPAPNQPPANQPPANAPAPNQSPYGQPPANAPAPNQSPYGQQPPNPYAPQQAAYGYGAAQPQMYHPGSGHRAGAPMRPTSAVPGVVKAAVLVTIICSTLIAGVYVLIGLALGVARDEVMAEVRKTPQFNELEISEDQLVAAIGIAIGLFLFWALAAIVLALFTWRGHNWARILLIISSAMTVLLSLIAIPFGVVTIAAGVGVIVMLVVPDANAFFGRKPQMSAPYPGPYSGPYPVNYPVNYPGPHPGQQEPYGQQPPQQPQQQQPQQPGPTDPKQADPKQADPKRDEDGKPPVW